MKVTFFRRRPRWWYGGFLKWGYPQMVGLLWKILSAHGWFFWVPHGTRKPPYDGATSWLWRSSDQDWGNPFNNGLRYFKHGCLHLGPVIDDAHPFPGETAPICRGFTWQVLVEGYDSHSKKVQQEAYLAESIYKSYFANICQHLPTFAN